MMNEALIGDAYEVFEMHGIVRGLVCNVITIQQLVINCFIETAAQ
jgi:hypothetical protein